MVRIVDVVRKDDETYVIRDRRGSHVVEVPLNGSGVSPGELAAAVSGKADTSALTSLSAIVTSKADLSALADKADSSTVTALSATVAAKAPLASPAFTGTPTGITKAHVGLGSVDNTADADKPVSTLQATAINLKADSSTVTTLTTTVGNKVAKGDLVVLDTDYATLELALAATPVGGTLEIRTAWTRTTTFTINKACTVRGGRGGSIAAGTATLTVISVTANNVSLDNLTLIGTDCTTAGTGVAISAVGASVGASIDALDVGRCTITNFNKYGVYGSFVTNFNIHDNTIAGISYSGCTVLSGVVGRIAGNKISNITMPTPFVNSYGIAMTRAGTSDLVANPRSSGIVCSGNVVDGNPTWEGIDTHGGERLVITNNQVYNCKIGIALVGCPGTSGDLEFAPLDITCTNNVIDSRVTDGSRGGGIQLVGAFPTPSTGTPAEYATGSIRNNIIRNHGATTSLQGGGISVYCTKGATVSGNTVINANKNGIAVLYENVDLGVSGNTFVDNWTPNLTDAPAIFIYQHNNSVTVAGNRAVRGAKVSAVVNTDGVRVHPLCTASSVQYGMDNNFAACTAAITDPLDVVTVTLPAITTLAGAALATAAVPNIQAFTASGTWTKPAGAKLLRVICIAGGSGGGSGRRGAVSTIRCGGGGGAGGGLTPVDIDPADLTATVAVTVGAGGAGGAAVTADDTSGNAGAAGTATTFGNYVSAAGGGASVGGTAALGTGGAGGGGLSNGSPGGNASVTGAGGTNAGTLATGGGGSAGAGGGITSANVPSNGAAALSSKSSNLLSSAGGVVDTTAPVAPTAPTRKGAPGPGGGGGAASITTAAQAGASGTGYGGGGGGGGASLNGNNSGAGGNGAPGYVLIITTF